MNRIFDHILNIQFLAAVCICSHFLFDTSSLAAPKLEVQRANLYELLGDKALDQMAAMIEKGYPGLNAINPPQSVKVSHRSQPLLLQLRQTLMNLKNSSDPNRRKQFLQATIYEFDRVYPNYRIHIDVQSQRSELSKSQALSWLRPDWKSLDIVPIEDLLNAFIRPDPANNRGLYFADELGNCGSWALAAISSTVTNNFRKLSVHHLNRYLNSHYWPFFKEVEPPLEFGDLIYFEISKYYHAAIFLGLDQKSGAEMVFNKIGDELAPPLTMTLPDLIQIFRQTDPELRVKFYRPLHGYSF